MTETLKKLFNARGERRVLLHHSSDKDGGVGHLMASEARVGLYTEAGYIPEDFTNHAYYDYIFGALGRPASIETIHDVEGGGRIVSWRSDHSRILQWAAYKGCPRIRIVSHTRSSSA